jgi:hypothetical protein
MSAELHEQAGHAAGSAHAFDSPEEVAHAKKHAIQNIGFFIVFFGLILFSVANYELSGVKNVWLILGFAAARAAWIGVFFAWLFGHFSYVIKTFVFAIFFLLGMIFLSMWDSTLPIFGNPISRSPDAANLLFQPKPVTPPKP